MKWPQRAHTGNNVTRSDSKGRNAPRSEEKRTTNGDRGEPEAPSEVDARFELPTAEPVKEVLSVADTASLLGVDKKTVYDAVRDGQLPARRVGEKRILILRSALFDWLAGRTRGVRQ